MKNFIRQLILVTLVLLLTSALNAGGFDSSSPLPAMSVAVLATKTAGKAFKDYAALSKREAEIIAILTSPAYEKLPYREREIKRAEYLAMLGIISREQNMQLKAYKVQLSNAIAALESVGPGQLAAAHSQLEGIRATMAADIGRQTITAGALADVVKLGGLSPQQKKQFKDYISQLKRKQMMEEQLQESGKKLQAAAADIADLLDYMDEVKNSIELAIIRTEGDIGVNTALKAIHQVKVMVEGVGGTKIIPSIPDHSLLLGVVGSGQVYVGSDRSFEDLTSGHERR